MRQGFLQYYRPSKENFEELWQTCIFILDTSVLLNLYRYPKNASDDLLKIFETISDRLWIPHQVALEYQENRLSVIAEQVRRYGDVKKVLEKSRNDITKELSRLQLTKRHALINPSDFLEQVNIVFAEFTDKLDKLAQEQPNIFDEDKLRNRIDRLLDEKVGKPPSSQDELDKMYKEGELRYNQGRPPGYKDSIKEDEKSVYFHRGLAFKREYGDFLLWKEIIEQAKQASFKRIIFITDDVKEDWWWEQHGKTIGPRPELVDEIQTESAVEIFYMYTSERFMKYAEDYLQVQVQPESVNQIGDITKNQDSYGLLEIKSDILQMAKYYRSDEEIRNMLGINQESLNEYWESIFEKLDVGNKANAIIKAEQIGLLISMREIEVLKEAERGLSNKEIAQELGLGEGTVRNYLSSAYKKLNARNRSEAIYKARKIGLL